MAWAMVVIGSVAAIKAGADIYAKNKAANRAEDAAAIAKAEEDVEKAKLKKRMDKYESFKFENPYENMENVYEDLTVNQQQAQFQAEQGAQQRANIMQGMQGAAGGSGIAALAQTMASQGQLQTQQISASIGAQESQQQRLKAGEASKIQYSERKGEGMVQSAEMGRVKTLMAMQQGDTAGAAQRSNVMDAQQMQAEQAVTEAWAKGVGDVAGAVGGAYTGGMSTGGGGGVPAGHEGGFNPNTGLTDVSSSGSGAVNASAAGYWEDGVFKPF